MLDGQQVVFYLYAMLHMRTSGVWQEGWVDLRVMCLFRCHLEIILLRKLDGLQHIIHTTTGGTELFLF